MCLLGWSETPLDHVDISTAVSPVDELGLFSGGAALGEDSDYHPNNHLPVFMVIRACSV